jgi:DNA-directed RNA polymerase specialized sigma24 family protein
MRRNKVLLQTLLALVLLWGVVAAVRAFAGSRQITAEKVAKAVDAAALEDWSGQIAPPDTAKAKQRDEKLRDIAGLVNRLDFAEREKTRDDRSTERLFRRMSPDEKKLFIDLTIRESMGKFMEAIDQLPPEKRKEFVEKGIREIQSGKTGEEMARAQELVDDLLETIASEGMRAYFEKASADTKLDLAPLMESMNEVMQGLRGQEFGPASR